MQVGTLSRVKGGGQTLLLLSSEPVLFARMRNPILKKSLLSLFVSFIFLVFRRKRQYSNHKMFQKLENWIYFKSSSKECHQCTMFLSTVFVDFLNLKLCLLIIYSPLDTTIQLKFMSVFQWVDIFIFFNVFVY